MAKPTVDAPTTAEFEAIASRVAALELRVTAIETAPKSVVFVPATDPIVCPVLKGALLGWISVEPASWLGQILVSGPDSNQVAIDNQRRLVAARDIKEARDYEVVVTALS